MHQPTQDDPIESKARKPGLSVAMCTYNGARYVKEQLDSIAHQTTRPIEIVICDDQSIDETPALIQSFSHESAIRVRFFRNDFRLGPAKNFAKAISLTEGSFVALSDQDDFWEPNKVERLLKAFDIHPEIQYAFSDATLIDNEGRNIGSNLWQEIAFDPATFKDADQLRILLKRNTVTGAGLAFRASMCRLVLPISTGWMHDYWIALLGSATGLGLAIGEPLYRYRLHTQQACGWKKKSLYQTIKESLAATSEDSRARLRVFDAFVERIAASGCAAGLAAQRRILIDQKRKHLSFRARARSRPLAIRVPCVLYEAAVGRYARYSNSWHSIARDLYPR